MKRSDSETWTDEGAPVVPEIELPVVHEPGQGFRVEELVGEGASGGVHAATDLDLERRVAVKILGERAVGRQDIQARFLAEARITSRLDHPGVVPIHALHRTEDGRLAYAMKLVEGSTLRDALLTDPPPLATRLEWFLRICDTVHYAHDLGVVHRDLKPENIMVGAHGEVWVMDWGIAARAEDPAPPPGRVAGTPGFLAPEQAVGGPPDPRADQYALALVLQEMVTLADAVAGPTPVARLAQNQAGAREPVRGAPPELVAILDRAAAVRPEDRYPSVRDLADDVRRYLRGEAVEARPDTPFQAAARWLGRHREGALVALGVLGLVIALVAVAARVEVLRERAAAQERQAEVARLVGDVASRAGEIDARLGRLEGRLGRIVAVAEERLARGSPVGGPVAWASDFDAGTVPGQRVAPYYDLAISVDLPVFLAPDGPRPEAAARLIPVGEALGRAVLRSAGARAEDRWRVVAEEGAPIAWASVALADGLSLSYPGHGGFPDGYDARDRPWYRLGAEADGPAWGAPYVDSGGLGLLLPCSAPLKVGDEVAGVASIKLPLDRLIGDLLDWPGAEAWLLDDEGRVVVRSSARGWRRGEVVLDNEALALAPFEVPAIAAAAREGRGATAETPSGLVVSHPLHTLGWTYGITLHE